MAGVADDRSAAFTWRAPENSGSFPVTHYQLTLGPGRRTRDRGRRQLHLAAHDQSGQYLRGDLVHAAPEEGRVLSVDAAVNGTVKRDQA